MDLTDVRCLIELANAGSVKGASESLDLSRATLRRRIKALEERVGVPLVGIGESSVNLTEAGAFYAEAAKPLVRQAEDLEQLVRTRGKNPCGRIRIAIGVAGPETIPFLAFLADRYSKLTYELRITVDPVHALSAGADMAVLLGGSYPLGDWLVTSLGNLPLRAYAHSRYLAATSPIQTLEDLRQHRLLHATIIHAGEPRWPLIDGSTWPIFPWVTTTDLGLVRQGVEAGFGVGMAYRPDIDDEIEPVLPQLLGTSLPMLALTTPAGAKQPQVRAVIDGLRDYIAKTGGEGFVRRNPSENAT